MAQKNSPKFQLPMYKYICQIPSCYSSVLNTCHYASFLCFLSFSLATKYQNHFRGKALSLIWENSQSLLLQIVLQPLSPFPFFWFPLRVCYTSSVIVTVLGYSVPFFSFYFLSAFWFGISTGEPIEVILPFCHNVFDF